MSNRLIVWQRVNDDAIYRVSVIVRNGERQLLTERATHTTIDGDPEWEEIDADGLPDENCEYRSGLPHTFVGWLIDTFRANPSLKLIAVLKDQASDDAIWQIRDEDKIRSIEIGNCCFRSLSASSRSLKGKLRWNNCLSSSYNDLPDDFQEYVIELLVNGRILPNVTEFELKD